MQADDNNDIPVPNPRCEGDHRTVYGRDLAEWKIIRENYQSLEDDLPQLLAQHEYDSLVNGHLHCSLVFDPADGETRTSYHTGQYFPTSDDPSEVFDFRTKNYSSESLDPESGYELEDDSAGEFLVKQGDYRLEWFPVKDAVARMIDMADLDLELDKTPSVIEAVVYFGELGFTRCSVSNVPCDYEIFSGLSDDVMREEISPRIAQVEKIIACLLSDQPYNDDESN